MRHWSRRPGGARRRAIVGLAASLGLVTALSASPGGADDRLAVPPNATWKTECGACHLPYPPALLPARSWRAIVEGLARHFDTDASLDPEATAEIATFLERHAGRDRGGPTWMRLTDTPWFRRKHREVADAVWARPAVRSPANCAACHRRAEAGDYDDDHVRIPTR